ncbi:primosomal protein N' [Limosilactobacillus mucosae]|uniref:Replication restart protein PriA n=1 Tax=Limosilactobacillus mucosae TaxID=97478 RepID=A0AAJ1HV69_LIMMU|nr:primosomal protein N' [Limosilactobacillus mucosae]MDC2830210.1 primosomal protein N' [Limosilactobacillus mucosae]MDC2837781.1 primosomal protein N' [Limosilactobacillus mucosae]MDC2849798.1 primosomal protein N' [Limosilactobacillus mucosae]MDC2853934.1 primosomal protein N' [Limosilactobacillus mucosae]
MAELAQVIVDVPTMQTDQPYTYAIPKRLENQIQVGMRVIVPFGRGKREVQGFVVGIDQPTEYDGTLKPIAGLMDLVPVVNPELLKLSRWMADQTYAFWISCLYTMLPNALKAKSHRVVRIIDEIDEQTALELFHGKDELDFERCQNDPKVVSQLLKLKRQGRVSFEYQVEDRARIKKETAIQPLMSFEQYEDERMGIRANAHAQQQLISYLQSLDSKTIKLKQAMQQSGLKAATFNIGEKRGWLKKTAVETYRTPGGMIPDDQHLDAPLKLNSDQKQAVAKIDQAIEQKQNQTFLLQGVTGSGKTEVYLQTMAKAIKMGKTALLLVPEISLTPQMVNRVRRRFGQRVAVLHSSLSDGERYDEWRRIERGEAQVVVGARSAVFAPLENLGLIIMDEEHETSYKQDETPRYHARDVASWRAKYHHAPLILGSATPSLESRARALAGVYQLLKMPTRVNQRPLPPVEVVDMRPEMQRNGETNFSDRLLGLLTDRLQKGEQSILMLNRRGFSSFIMCRDCGFVLKCPNCDISLTLHMDSHTMKCHYCGHEEPIPSVCPQCHGRHIRYYGTGTEKVAAELQKLLPNARVIRMDVDTTRHKGMHAKLLKEFGAHQADILLGTQMIAKGLDFPNVTLVGVLNADTGLDLPDFRASERTFDLLSQVSGRAGRADKPGHVVIQTFNPDNYAIRYAQLHDYEDFFKAEMNIRYQAGYPPYYYTVRIMASNEDEDAAAKAIYAIKDQLNAGLGKDTVVLGPTPRPIARMKRRYYYQIIVKYKHDEKLHELLLDVMKQTQAKSRQDTLVSIDPEPQYFM